MRRFLPRERHFRVTSPIFCKGVRHVSKPSESCQLAQTCSEIQPECTAVWLSLLSFSVPRGPGNQSDSNFKNDEFWKCMHLRYAIDFNACWTYWGRTHPFASFILRKLWISSWFSYNIELTIIKLLVHFNVNLWKNLETIQKQHIIPLLKVHFCPKFIDRIIVTISLCFIFFTKIRQNIW